MLDIRCYYYVSPVVGLVNNPPLTSFDTISDGFSKQLILPVQPMAGQPGVHQIESSGTPEFADLPITVMNRAMFLMQRPPPSAVEKQLSGTQPGATPDHARAPHIHSD